MVVPCPRCGAANEDGNNVCATCGASLACANSGTAVPEERRPGATGPGQRADGAPQASGASAQGPQSDPLFGLQQLENTVESGVVAGGSRPAGESGQPPAASLPGVPVSPADPVTRPARDESGSSGGGAPESSPAGETVIGASEGAAVQAAGVEPAEETPAGVEPAEETPAGDEAAQPVGEEQGQPAQPQYQEAAGQQWSYPSPSQWPPYQYPQYPPQPYPGWPGEQQVAPGWPYPQALQAMPPHYPPFPCPYAMMPGPYGYPGYQQPPWAMPYPWGPYSGQPYPMYPGPQYAPPPYGPPAPYQPYGGYGYGAPQYQQPQPAGPYAAPAGYGAYPDDSRSRRKRKGKKGSTGMVIAIVLVLLVIGGSIAAAFMLTSKSGSSFNLGDGTVTGANIEFQSMKLAQKGKTVTLSGAYNNTTKEEGEVTVTVQALSGGGEQLLTYLIPVQPGTNKKFSQNKTEASKLSGATLGPMLFSSSSQGLTPSDSGSSTFNLEPGSSSSAVDNSSTGTSPDSSTLQDQFGTSPGSTGTTPSIQEYLNQQSSANPGYTYPQTSP